MAESEKQIEQKRVDKVVQEISDHIHRVATDYTEARAEMKRVQQNYSANTSVNYFEVDDRIETSAELQQQRALASRLIENEQILRRQLDTFHELEKSPYFGRIDIQDPGEAESERLYIGTASFTDEDQNFLVYDWRAPISSIYYNGTLGKVAYETPAGIQQTDLKKKRQFLIQNGEITSMFDTNETVGDEMLQHVLGEQNDDTMQNIVSTIQREQNDIIRDTKSDLLVVQGVAGSGKTSAILQRIAFLLYHSRDELEADQIILFSPNRLFSHYISDVLPSLGERNMRQVTLAEFVNQRLQGLTVESIFDRYERANDLSESQQQVQQFKESEAFMTAVHDYSQTLTPEHFNFTHILFNGDIFFNKRDIETIYQSLPNMQPAERFLQTKNKLIKQLKKRIDIETDAQWVAEEIDQLSDEDYRTLLGNKERGRFQQVDDEIHYIARKIITKRLRIVYDAIYNNYFLDTYAQYADFLANVDHPEISDSAWQAQLTAYQKGLEYHKTSLDDVAPLLYLRDILTGSGQNRRMQHLFVDEMQDYSVAQLLYFHHAFPKAKMTYLGDSEQALYSDVEAPDEILQKLKDAFHVNKARLIRLTKSYRSTYPITTFAKSILPDGDQIQAFNREGELPKIVVRYDEDEAYTAVDQCINHALKTNGTVAILTKNMAEAQAVYQHLHRDRDITLLKDTDRTLPKGVFVLPIYLAKGLEFDSVIAWNVSQENFPSSRDVGILYTIASRAMHELALISVGPVTKLISENIPNDVMRIEHAFTN
ncbi:superfamily I DNA/RNA helicase [Secundilactobacillus oryzae JCM 18671]|uniref:Superfamily I DNA/RNA helicase n=1 Tax=Secundilactobacillus oryzae JCM 18671 TaxID=1291743 RepID=A0A081BH75_9LACO|nr:RNA polymerase recycling motor HelD [Secundilactobacillus oryzae]GAK47393.1 superfamily I DNA/RNA helicase [Secundilactobacillus oryzae JCM 18671]